MYFATEHFRHYLVANSIKLYTDHKPLTYLFTTRIQVNSKLARWSAKSSKLKAEVIYRSGATMGPADTFSRVIKGRPEREQRDKETPENRAPVKCPRGQLQEFENEDTEERALSLPRELGIPQQRVTFLKGNAGDEVDDNSDYEEEENESQEERELEESAEDHKREMMEVSIDARSRRRQGQRLTEQQIGLLSTEQKASIEKLRGRALEHGEKPTFHISVDFDVTRAEEAITNEQERLIKRKEFQQRKLVGACITEAEANANDRADLKDRGENKRFFPPTTMI
jgi:hypothetical protein